MELFDIDLVLQAIYKKLNAPGVSLERISQPRISY